METNNILSANILDILFDGRNKEYGAYELRNTYDRRIFSSLGVTAIALIIVCISVTLKTSADNKIFKMIDIDVTLTSKDIEKEKLQPAPKLPEAKPIKTLAYVPPIIVKDKFVLEPPVKVEELVDARIDIKNIDGKIDDGGIAPPQEIKNSQVLEAPIKNYSEDDNKFIPVEIEATLKGDWNVYIKKEIEKNIEELTEAGESGTCLVKFIVSKDGSVSNVEAITMKGSKLAEVAVNAIRKGPKWIPARQNDREVNAYRQQPITFTISE